MTTLKEVSVTNAKVSFPLTQVVRMAKRAFIERTTATPRFCYLPLGLCDAFNTSVMQEIRTMARLVSALDPATMSLVAYDGMVIRSHSGSDIIVTEVSL